MPFPSGLASGKNLQIWQSIVAKRMYPLKKTTEERRYRIRPKWRIVANKISKSEKKMNLKQSDTVIVCLSGRGDKDLSTYMQAMENNKNL